MKNDIHTKMLKNYLLGRIAEDEAQVIDEALISNDELEETLMIAEDLLIEDYLEKELTNEELDLFHTNFLISNERKEQVRTIAQLKNYSKNIEFDGLSFVKEDKEDTDESNIFQTIASLFTRIPVRAFAGLLIIGIVGSLLWIFLGNSSNGLSPLEIEYAKLNNASLAKSEKVSELVLVSGITRGEGDSNELSRANMHPKVLFKVALRAKPTVNESFKVEIVQNNQTKFTLPKVTAIENDFQGELRFLLPREIFEKGRYGVRITSSKNPQNKIVYPVSIK